MWRLYLVGGALAFQDGRMGVDQILRSSPDADGPQRAAAGAAPAGDRRSPLGDFLDAACRSRCCAVVGRARRHACWSRCGSGRHAVVDVAWGLGFAAVAVAAFAASGGGR